jgi:hypothetical protein
MWRRLWFLFVVLFFVAMNVLLWRSEFGGRHTLGSPVRPEVVFERMLLCSEGSSLYIRHRGAKVGFCRWSPQVVERPRSQAEDAAEPEGMVKEVSGYDIDFDGQFFLKDGTRLRFHCLVMLDTNRVWQEFRARAVVHWPADPKPFQLDVRALAAEEAVRISPPLVDEDGKTEEVIRFADLQEPDKLLRRLGGPLLPTTLAALGFSLNQVLPPQGPPPSHARPAALAALGLNWEARKGHRVPLGHALIPVYRLQAQVLDRYLVRVFVTDSGEIFRIELPNEIVLINDHLLNM